MSRHFRSFAFSFVSTTAYPVSPIYLLSPVRACFLHGFAPGFFIVFELPMWELSSGLEKSIFVLIRSISKSQANRRKICFPLFTADWHMPEISRFRKAASFEEPPKIAPLP